jgi:Subtilase family
MHRTQPQRRIGVAARRAAAPAVVAALVAAGPLTGSDAVNATETDVMAWAASVDPSIEVDQTANCMPLATDAVAYRDNRLVVRSSLLNPQVETRVNTALNTLYGTVAFDYVDTPSINRITFPIPPGFPAIVPVISVPLNARSGGQNHTIVTAARTLRGHGYRLPTSPDYVYHPSGPYSHYWPIGYPTATGTPTAARTTTVPVTGLPVGSGVRVWVADTGVAPRGAGVLPNLTQLASGDDEQPNRVLNLNDPAFADYPAAGHLLAISGSINITAPGVVMQGLRVNERSGLLTDVDAADRIARALRTTLPANYPAMLDLSFGTAVCDAVLGGTPLQPIGTEAIVEVVDKFDVSQPQGMLVIASAGNVQSTRPHYPAAFTNVLSVGALDGTKDPDSTPWTAEAKTAPVASFSNTGSWVDVYTPGVALATNHVTNIRFQELAQALNGAGTVNGTSFSVPIMSGYLAEYMSTNGGKVRAASTQLLGTGLVPLAQCDTGRQVTGKAVMLGTFNGRITDPGAGAGTPC